MKFLKNVFQLFYPNICVGCDKTLFSNEIILCSYCRHDLPLIKNIDFDSNEVSAMFYGRVSLKMCGSFLYLKNEGITKKLIHHLKYRGNQDIGTFIGSWFGTFLKESNLFNFIDYIVPVPLHSLKLKKRGYNQLTTFGECLSQILEAVYVTDVLKRLSSTKSQTYKKRFDRFSNINTKFNLTDLSFFENKHILLIDDVITTGATLEACCLELQKTKNITISIVTIAYTQIN